MADHIDKTLSRRQFVRNSALVSAGIALGPHFVFGKAQPGKLVKRTLGATGWEATTLGLGGQGSLQWTPSTVDAPKIIVKAFNLGVNYFDTSNVYGPSQSYYGKAFRELNLVPGQPGYKESVRRSIFLTSKTALRFGKGGRQEQGLTNVSNGAGTHAADDIKRTLSLIFGDGQGSYPQGAYLDMVLMHSMTSMKDVEALYLGYEHPDPKAEDIGAFATLIDYRDGTNITGLNPKEEKLIRHIGFSGHQSPALMMEMIQRDSRNILEAMLIAINANDRVHFNMQYNAIPVAAARNLGVIGMKVFADGAMYSEKKSWTMNPSQIVQEVGSTPLPSRRLVEYTLSTPGVHLAIIGTGRIDNDPAACQLTQNLQAAQIAPNALSVSDRREIEKLAGQIKSGRTNYFQEAAQTLAAPRNPAVLQKVQDLKRTAQVEWQTAYSGDEPIVRYEVWRDHKKVGQVAHRPQITKKPFVFSEAIADKAAHNYEVVAVDAAGRTAKTGDLVLASV